MALVRVQLMQDAVPPSARRELIERVTDATASVLGQDVRPHIWVLLEDVARGDWGVGGAVAVAAR
jgi:4-oxalocrotonate tautomerase